MRDPKALRTLSSLLKVVDVSVLSDEALAELIGSLLITKVFDGAERMELSTEDTVRFVHELKKMRKSLASDSAAEGIKRGVALTLNTALTYIKTDEVPTGVVLLECLLEEMMP